MTDDLLTRLDRSSRHETGPGFMTVRERMDTAAEAKQEIEQLWAELALLRVIVVEAGHYTAVCPVPTALAMEARAELSDSRHRIARAAAQIIADEQSEQK